MADKKRAQDFSVMAGKRKKRRMENGSEGCHMNEEYTKEPFMSKLTESWRDGVAMKDALTSAELLSSPFQCCQLPDFICSGADSGSGIYPNSSNGTEVGRDGFLKDLVSELLKLKFYEKNNDLYQFHQSDDLKKFKSPCIAALRSFFHSECVSWLRRVTGLELSDTIDMTCSKYEYTDTLLCHDDELEGRRIAFILYLVQDWSREDGGTLDLFDTDDFGQPRDIVKSLVPTWNSMVFFDVNAVSFHQVSEVVSAHKTRLSVNGWFHGPPSPRPPPHVPLPLALHPPASLGLEVLSDWINPLYLDVGVQSQIQKQFEEDSQIQLPDFLLEEKYEKLCEEMVQSREEGKWLEEGPANRKHTCVAVPSSYLPLTRTFMTLLLSKPFCLLLAHMTELDLAQDLIKLSTPDTQPLVKPDQQDQQDSESLIEPDQLEDCLDQHNQERSYSESNGCTSSPKDQNPSSPQSSLATPILEGAWSQGEVGGSWS